MDLHIIYIPILIYIPITFCAIFWKFYLNIINPANTNNKNIGILLISSYGPGVVWWCCFELSQTLCLLQEALRRVKEANRGLPPGWRAFLDPHGNLYYGNASTGAASWVRPTQ